MERYANTYISINMGLAIQKNNAKNELEITQIALRQAAWKSLFASSHALFTPKAGEPSTHNYDISPESLRKQVAQMSRMMEIGEVDAAIETVAAMPDADQS